MIIIDVRGQGVATEAVRTLYEHAFGKYQLAGIDSATDFDNLASKRVMEKLGMTALELDSEGGHSFTHLKQRGIPASGSSRMKFHRSTRINA